MEHFDQGAWGSELDSPASGQGIARTRQGGDQGLRYPGVVLAFRFLRLLLSPHPETQPPQQVPWSFQGLARNLGVGNRTCRRLLYALRRAEVPLKTQIDPATGKKRYYLFLAEFERWLLSPRNGNE